ncbi:hypothetical protein M3Y96_00757100 [Aphelenchoides besseyi]|nr:hypothetical protein M3Y96_00757100 [Aphelenchoides besseyi]
MSDVVQREEATKEEGETTRLADEIENIESITIEVPLCSIESDEEAARHVDDPVEFYHLLHPRANTAALYYIGKQEVYEVLQKDMEKRSCFFNDSVINPTKISFLTPIHPFFLIIPYLLKQPKGTRFKLTNILNEDAFPALSLISAMPSTSTVMSLVNDVHENGEYERNEQKLIGWLKSRFDKLLGLLKSTVIVSKPIKEDAEALRYYAFDNFFADNLPKTFSSFLQHEWYIREVIVEKKTPKNKRTMESMHSEKKATAVAATKKRKLMKAADGTMKITNFFK